MATDPTLNRASDVNASNLAGSNAADRTTNPDANPDPITGARGSHPVGTGIGAASAGAAGAMIGSIIPGIGTAIGGAVGAVVGAVAGGYAGKAIAEEVNPSVEDEYWRSAYQSRPYVSSGETYDDYRPAYQYGWESRTRHQDRSFDEAEPELRQGWESGENRQVGWEKASPAIRDAWNRLQHYNATSANTGKTTDPDASDLGSKTTGVTSTRGSASRLATEFDPADAPSAGKTGSSWSNESDPT